MIKQMMKVIAVLLLVPMMGYAQVKQTTDADTVRHEVVLETTMGNICVALYNDTPLHRDNFLDRVRTGYYNGCIFQRVIRNFMIQAGNPQVRKVAEGDTTHYDVERQVPAEIRYPEHYHRRGQLCAAREGDETNPTFTSSSHDFYITWGRNFSPRQMEYYVERLQRDGKAYVVPDSVMQQIYIRYGGVPHLDGGYTVFGEVIEGLDVVERIQEVPVDQQHGNRPLEDVVILRATIRK